MRIRHSIWIGTLVPLLALLPAWAHAQSIEGVLMPGEVISDHAKWESECSKCHEPFKKSAQPRLCNDCHKDTAADIRAKIHFHGKLEDTTCSNCHTDHKGRKANITLRDPGTFNHDKTSFPLKGAHKKPSTKCTDCHNPKAKYRAAPHLCNDCHRKVDDEKGHKGKLGTRCEECHSENNWRVERFDHSKTRFKVDGAHEKTECKGCHEDRLYKDTPRTCVACHKKNDDKDGHEGHFGTKCESCHTTRAWDESIFDHDRDAHYPLKGKHRDADCESCHEAPLYTVKLPSKCVACHREDDNKKGHKGSLGEKCESCHNEKDWKTTVFDHDKDTDYPLTGKHRKATCESCHKTGVTVTAGKAREKLPTQCSACHRGDDQKNGHKGKFGEKCETCHTTKEWKDITFDHDRDTKYALRGKHVKATCVSCHTGSLYGDKAATDCVSCHRKDDDKKGHKGALGPRCEACHNEIGWRIEAFDHNKSRFPLTGGHVRVECKKCHQGLDYKKAPMACNACHEKEDVHKRRLGIDCETCHNTRTWKSWDFDHDKTGYRLDGAHAKVECYACHKAPMQKVKGHPAVARRCTVCHGNEDVHQGSFGNSCERCHVTTAWRVILRW